MVQIARIERLRPSGWKLLRLRKPREIAVDLSERLIVRGRNLICPRARKLATTRCDGGFENPSEAAPEAHWTALTPHSGAFM